VRKYKKIVLDNYPYNVQNKRKKSHRVTSNKKYESFNVVSETGDSIYCAASPFEEQIVGGEIFVAESKIEEIVKRIIDQRLRNSINNSKENDD
jgi:hypothetical protein